jgi:FAD synthetase
MVTKVLAGGCFNRLHEGHVYFLMRAKALGDELTVVLANDSHNQKPYAVKAEQRKEALEKLGIADRVLIGDSDQFVGVVIKEKPQIIALGYDQSMPKDVQAKLSELKVKVVIIDKHGDASSSKI